MIRITPVESHWSYCVESTSAAPSIPPATFATRDLTTADKVLSADVAASEAGTNEASDDGWLECTPEKPLSVCQRAPEDSTSSYPSAAARDRYKFQCVFTTSALYHIYIHPVVCSFSFFLSSPNLSHHRLDVYLPHMVWPLKHAARGSLEMQDAKKSPKSIHLRTIVQPCRAISSQLRHISTIGKKLVKQQYLLQMSPQRGELRPTSG